MMTTWNLTFRLQKVSSLCIDEDRLVIIRLFKFILFLGFNLCSMILCQGFSLMKKCLPNHDE